MPHLHGDLSVVHEHLPREEVGSDCGFVACAELLVDLPSISAFYSALYIYAYDSVRWTGRGWTYILVH